METRSTRWTVAYADPFPGVGIVRIADAPRDGAGVDVAVIDVPAIRDALDIVGG